MYICFCTDRSTDLDIPLEFIPTTEYNATLGHKACHSFGENQNARFENLYHPRYDGLASIFKINVKMLAVVPICPLFVKV